MQWEQLVAHQIDRWFVHGKGLVIQMIPQYLSGCRYHTIYYILLVGNPISIPNIVWLIVLIFRSPTATVTSVAVRLEALGEAWYPGLAT